MFIEKSINANDFTLSTAVNRLLNMTSVVSGGFLMVKGSIIQNIGLLFYLSNASVTAVIRY